MKIAKDRLCIVSTYPAHMRGREWNTGGGVHPLENFWAYRFLENCYSEAYQGNEPPKVGTKTKYREKDPRSSISLYSDSSRKFSMKGLEGSWIPYGGGASICPGRHLAKHHFLVTVAAMILLFDLEVIASEKMMQMSNFYYGVGVQHPKGQIPFRIRRRV
jgi:hypothetical protein